MFRSYKIQIKKMKKMSVKALLSLVFLLLIVDCTLNSDAPTIIDVSGSIGEWTRAYSSLMGGKVIYIRGTNFGSDPSQVQVSVGDYPCIIEAEGITEQTIACRTTPVTDSLWSVWNLVVTVRCGDKPEVTCTSGYCRVHYDEGRTPFIDEITPRSATGNSQLAIWGAHRIDDLGDGRSTSVGEIKYFQIGDNTCSHLDITQDEDSWQKHWRSELLCNSYLHQEAGEYSFTEMLSHGQAQMSLRTQQTSFFTQNNYTQRVLPKIDAISHNRGGTFGHSVQVSGSGFGNNLQDYSCEVAGESCSVVGIEDNILTVDIPEISAGNTELGKLAKDPTDNEEQSCPFLGAQGARYQRFAKQTWWKNSETLMSELQAGTYPQNLLIEEKIITELSSSEIYGERYVEYIRGYFHAPVSGDYHFQSTCDDSLIMKMSTVQNSANIANLQTLLKRNSYNFNHFNSFERIDETEGRMTVTLTEGYYYFELVTENVGGPGHFRIFVSMPELSFPTTNPTWQIDEVRIKPESEESQQIEVEVTAASGTFKIFYYQGDNLRQGVFTVGFTAEQFSGQIDNLPNFKNYGLSVSVTTYDAAGAETSDTASIARWKYLVELSKWREDDTPLPYTNSDGLVDGGNGVSLTVTRIRAHSPPLRGTFKMSIDGIPVTKNGLPDGEQNFEYNTNGGIISPLRFAYNLRELEVVYKTGSQFDEEIHFFIEYVGRLGASGVTTFDVSLMTGGSSGISAQINTVREYSSRPLYSPIPYDFLRMASETPAINLKFKDIPAYCENCGYEVLESLNPTVSSASLTGATLTAGITLPTPAPQRRRLQQAIDISEVTVSLLGVQCLSVTGTIDNFQCTFPTNIDGSPTLPAGTDYYKIHVESAGYSDATALGQVTINLAVNSVTPAVSSPGGGVHVTLAGAGFPLEDSQVNDLSIQLCGNAVTELISVANQEIVFVAPVEVTTCVSGASSTIMFGGQTVTFAFNYDAASAPVITSLSIPNASPVLKTSLTITGTFNAANNLHVFMYQGGVKKYEPNINSKTGTEIVCTLGGGKTGDYDIVVFDETIGASLPNANSQFSYKIVVTAVSPTSGSLGGGYDITITGYNMAESFGSTNVFIGDEVNSLCIIKSVTDTSVVCTVPRILGDISQNADQALDVQVFGRLIEKSICEGTCTFTYTQATTATVDDTAFASVPTYKKDDVVTVTGSGLTGATITINGVSVTPTSNSDTEIVFNYPSLEAGTHEIEIFVNGGRTYPGIKATTPLEMTGSSDRTGSLAGNYITVTGNGFSTSFSSWVVELQCPDQETIPLPISSIPDHNTIIVAVPEQSADIQCNLILSQSSVQKTFSINYRLTETTSISVTATANANQFQIVENTLTDRDIINVEFVKLDCHGMATEEIVEMTISSSDATTATVQAVGDLPAGKYKVRAEKTGWGFAQLDADFVEVAFAAQPTLDATVMSSFNGGKSFTISGTGFVTTNIQNNDVSVCGNKAKIISASSTALVVQSPPLVTAETQDQYTLAMPSVISGTPIADSLGARDAFDADLNTVYRSANAACYLGYDFGENRKADIYSVRFAADPEVAAPAEKLDGALVEVSDDGTTWSTLFALDTNSLHSGYNSWRKEDASSHRYRFIRFSHTDVSQCFLSELQVTGVILSTQSVTIGTDKVCDAILMVNTDITYTGAVTYSDSETSLINIISPAFGSSSGGTTVTLTGTGFISPSVVTIDGIDCAVQSQTSTTIVCLTALRPSPPAEGNSFVVTTNGGNLVHVISQPFLYIDRWSDSRTWGGDASPIEGDSVIVPKGMTLLVDESTPILNSVIVEGKIQFADESDMTFDVHHFLIMNGQFQAGTESAPYQHQLTFTLYGGYYGKQIPLFGNKVIGCRNCKFNMHGQVRTPTWTQLASTIMPQDTTLTLVEAVDWKVGERIAVAASSFNHFESEDRVITAVSGDKMTITVGEPFKFKHFAAVESFGGEDIVMRAEVGLLSRNIQMRGDPTSADTEYGSHLMLNGKENQGLVGKISYSEFTHCGQPRVIGRYCTHFHMAGEVPNSYVRGISVHHSFARVITIHGTHQLLFEKNVGYHVKGHNVFLEDGIETQNVIQDNLMITTIASLTMLQSDTSVASYWITNPYNTVKRNHAAGGDFYGFWYEIKEHPDGPSATRDICPMGMRIGEAADNVAHSNIRFGLRIFKLSARKFPCLPSFNEADIDPFASNPAIHSQFTNFTLWKNEECGFLGEELGYTTISGFKTIDSKKGGLQFHKTNYTKELVIAEDHLVVGYSSGNGPADLDADYNNARGIIASRTDGLKFSNIRFHNFGPTMTPLQSCSECYHFKLWVSGGKTTEFEQISYNNIQGSYIFWENWRREIFIDLDGSLTQPFYSQLSSPPSPSKASITPNRPSIEENPNCHLLTSTDNWDDSVWCDDSVSMRSILFTNAIPRSDFNGIDIKVIRLTDAMEDISTRPEEDFSEELMVIIKSGDIKNSWAMPFISGDIYNVHWKWGIDFTHLAIAPNPQWGDSDKVILRFNYTDARELFEIAKWYQKQVQTPYITAADQMLDGTTCQNGDYYQDGANRYLFVCVSGQNRQVREWIDVNGIRCRDFCPIEPDEGGVREDFFRYWSDVDNWDGTLPVAGENVTIPYEWQLVMDVSPPKLNFLEVNGILIFDDTADRKLQAHYIWVKNGRIVIGTENTAFTHQAEIILHGEKDDTYMVLDPDASGNKLLAVTGGLFFYGQVPATVWTKLTAVASVGATSITVEQANDWAVGDKIVIAPSYAGRAEFEEREITSISGTTINFTPALEHEHYGDSTATITNSVGVLDTRAAVGLLTRNIKISAGPDANNWGCRVFVYGYNQLQESGPPIWKNGYVKLQGVEFDHCSQYDTTYAGLTFKNIGSNPDKPNLPSLMTGSSMHHCGGYCMFIGNIANLQIDNNVIFQAKKFLVYVEETLHDYKFTNNLMIGALKRPSYDHTNMLVDDVAAYQQYFTVDFANANLNVDVSDNLVQGSEGEGFVFPLSPCQYLDTYPFIKNTAGSCEIGVIYDKLPGQNCIGARNFVAYACQIGLMANPTGSQTELKYSEMLFADNGRAVTLRYAHETDENTALLSDSYITGISRPDCPTCYSATTNSYCQGGYAIRMFTATISGENFPLIKHPTTHDVICTRQAFDFKAFIDNVQFENFWFDSTSDANSANRQPFCTNMKVFKRHTGASDGTASHHLTNSPCVNCDQRSWAYFAKPNVGWQGWFGGCGELDCTGPNNYLVHDHDGSFLGEVSQLLSNNSVIGEAETQCDQIEELNGHWCHYEELAVLEYESIAPDFNTRIMWPVHLKYDGGNWNSTTNAWKEWQWNGPEPMNLRLARFWSVIKLHEKYNMTFESQPPSDMRFQIQKTALPSGNANDWAIIKYHMPVPNTLEVLVNNQVVKPNKEVNGVYPDLATQTNICGANNFFWENATIQFVVNGVNDCQVRVRLTSYVQVTTNLAITLNQFINGGETSFISNLCAFLGITTDKVKIVSVTEISSSRRMLQSDTAISVRVVITHDEVDDDDEPVDNDELADEMAELERKTSQGLKSGSIDSNVDPDSVQTVSQAVSGNGNAIKDCDDLQTFSIDLNECVDRCDYTYQIYEDGICKTDCSKVQNSPQTYADDSTDICNCNNDYLWDAASHNCRYDCDAQGDDYIYNEELDVCQKDCENIDGSTDSLVEGLNDRCDCQPGKTWKNAQCVDLNCQEDRLSNGISNNDEACQCRGIAYWSTELDMCVPNCLQDPYSRHIVDPEDFQECLCESSYIWNDTFVGCTIDCTGRELSVEFPVELNKCGCQHDLWWNNQLKKCQVRCNMIAYAIPTSRNNNLRSCSCRNGFIWNSDNYKCEFNCDSDENANGLEDGSYSACKCNAGFQWVNHLSGCYRMCGDMSHAKNKRGPTPDTCDCMPKYKWHSGSCKRECLSPADDEPTENDQCTCKKNSFWNASKERCIVDCSLDPLAKRQLNIICKCTRYAQWDVQANECACMNRYVKSGNKCRRG